MVRRKSESGWRIDWAGSHGTALGTVNAILTTISLAIVGHIYLIGRLDIPILAVVAMVGMICAIGMIFSLARIAVVGNSNKITILYRIVCWLGATSWDIAALLQPHWTARGIVEFFGALCVAAGIAGVLVDLADHGTGPETSDVETSGDILAPITGPRVDAGPWIKLIKDICDLDVEIRGIQPFDTKTPDGRPVGRWIEVLIPSGRLSWKAIKRFEEEITNALGLDPGCGARVIMGANRKIALIEITEINVLSSDQPYPEDYSTISVYDPLPMMVSADGNVTGPECREHNIGIFGEAGSGKSNTAQVIGVGVARMEEALLFDIDCTGQRLSMGLLGPFLRGEVDSPAVCWSATDPTEAWLMLRALQRVSIARNNGYVDLMLDADDDKIPISKYIPHIFHTYLFALMR
jgi:hypothetical protein